MHLGDLDVLVGPERCNCLLDKEEQKRHRPRATVDRRVVSRSEPRLLDDQRRAAVAHRRADLRVAIRYSRFQPLQMFRRRWRLLIVEARLYRGDTARLRILSKG